MNADVFTVSGLDHIVLCVRDVARTREFYEHVLGMVAVVDGPGERAGATGPILSIYVNAPDVNLLEISNLLN
jgi:catechol 2,3-dioxygenase-like lactoylglutathione lyase family enzyme